MISMDKVREELANAIALTIAANPDAQKILAAYPLELQAVMHDVANNLTMSVVEMMLDLELGDARENK